MEGSGQLQSIGFYYWKGIIGINTSALGEGRDDDGIT
jgi:hypothetical protein